MPAPKKYNDELRERATRLAVEARRDPASAVGAIRRIADQLGVHPEALRVWVKQAETDAGVRPGTTSSDADRLASIHLNGPTVLMRKPISLPDLLRAIATPVRLA